MPFLLRPAPLPGESLSSWRQRSGSANGFIWFPTHRSRNRADPDLQPDADELNWLSEEFAQSVTRLKSLCLDRFKPLAVGERVGGQFTRWILSCSSSAESDEAMSGYCPECLRTDEVPYFRLAWRFAFLTHCPIHHQRLLTKCPGCNRPCWPTSHSDRQHYPARVGDMRHCPECGKDLGQADTEIDAGHRESGSLLEILHDMGSTAADDRFPRQDYFRALWSTCRIISRRVERFDVAGILENFQEISGFHVKGRTIEKQPARVRQTIIAGASRLLEDWPERFIDACVRAGISRTDCGARHGGSPEWFNAVVQRRLAKSVNWITPEDVSLAVADIKATGGSVSKNALRRKFGVSESRAIDEILDQRRDATRDELTKLCRHYYRLIEQTPPSRDQQRTLCRDFLIVLVSAVSGQKLETACLMAETDIHEYLTIALRAWGANPELAIIFETLHGLLDQYKSGIRLEFAFRAKSPTDAFFITRFGMPIDGHTIRERFARILKDLFEPRLWNSVDIFQHTLTGETSRARPATPSICI